jgi:Protein of unknwon function (DUF3310)
LWRSCRKDVQYSGGGYGVAEALPVTDTIDHPSHYSRWKMEAIEFIAVNNLPWWLANVIKYCIRYDAKDGLQDLYKARSYLEMQIRHLEGIERFWEKPVAEQRSLEKHKQEQANQQGYQEALQKATLDYPKTLYVSPFGGKEVEPVTYAMPEYAPPARYCSCGVNITAEGFSCWDDDCMHKIKSSSKIHQAPERCVPK